MAARTLLSATPSTERGSEQSISLGRSDSGVCQMTIQALFLTRRRAACVTSYSTIPSSSAQFRRSSEGASADSSNFEKDPMTPFTFSRQRGYNERSIKKGALKDARGGAI